MDASTVKHVTVRLSTPELKAEKSFYILHWRLEGGSSALPKPDEESALRGRRQRHKATMKRRVQRKKDKKEQERNGGRGDKKYDGYAGGLEVVA